ncbi:MobA/MobL family protein [mine drainage metagenome]|uniref:MobA/MobL family protein n=1 Tax=mine drainage metagenome TaxID=410659 RepID=A0A1J5RFS7_9ZZZZ
MNKSYSRHLSMSVKPIRRHAGDSLARQAAYIRRSSIVSPRTGERFDFRSVGSAESDGLVGWSGSIDQLIRDAECRERRSKAVEGRAVIVGLPHEFDLGTRASVASELACYFAARHGVAVLWAVHPPADGGDRRNYHAHLVLTSRRVAEEAQLGEKTRELDSLRTGPGHIEAFRSWWTNHLNQKLVALGFEPNVEHRSFLRLGIKREPGGHLGERRTAAIRHAQRARRPRIPAPQIADDGSSIFPRTRPKIPAPTVDPGLSDSSATEPHILDKPSFGSSHQPPASPEIPPSPEQGPPHGGGGPAAAQEPDAENHDVTPDPYDDDYWAREAARRTEIRCRNPHPPAPPTPEFEPDHGQGL